MALTNFIVTVVGVGAAILLFRGDVKQSAAIFRRNLRHIRNWLEEESASASASKYGTRKLQLSIEQSAPKKLDSQVQKKDIPKDEKH